MSTFWQDNRILVTGGNGFLGTAVLNRLAERGTAVVYAPHSAEYDLRYGGAVVRLLQDTAPDVVIHLAASVGGIAANADHPGRFLYENLIMGAHMLHESYRAGVKKFVTIGTVCAYPKHCPVPFKETDLWNGYPEETNAPYGIAKKTILAMGQAYRSEYGFNAIGLLPTNLYGPHDSFDPHTSHVIPALIRRMSEAVQRVTLWGSGEASRDFLYVADAAEGILRAAELYNGAEPVNLGSGQEVTIKQLAYTIADCLGFSGVIEWDTSKPDGQPRRQLDTSLAKAAFHWQASTPLRIGLERTIKWYQQQRVAL